jgi:hypothetical protein
VRLSVLSVLKISIEHYSTIYTLYNKSYSARNLVGSLGSTSRIFIIYRPGARPRGIRRNISRSDDIFRWALPRSRKISSLREISPNPSSGGSINDILYRKLKNSLSNKFRINFKPAEYQLREYNL